MGQHDDATLDALYEEMDADRAGVRALVEALAKCQCGSCGRHMGGCSAPATHEERSSVTALICDACQAQPYRFVTMPTLVDLPIAPALRALLKRMADWPRAPTPVPAPR